MAIAAGSLRHRVTLQSSTITPNEYGEQVKTWATSKTVWAKVETVSGTERVIGDQFDGRDQFKFTMRSGLTEMLTNFRDYRFVFRSRNFHPVYQSNPMERGELVEFTCVEAV